MRLAFAMMLTLGTLSAAPVPKEHKKRTDDTAAILGTWTTHRLTVNGNELNARDTHTFVFEAEGKCYTYFGQGQRSEWTFRLDPTGEPKRLKWMNKDGSPSHECVYELVGDNLKLGFITDQKIVPNKIEPTIGMTLYEMKREKSKK